MFILRNFKNQHNKEILKEISLTKSLIFKKLEYQSVNRLLINMKLIFTILTIKLKKHKTKWIKLSLNVKKKWKKQKRKSINY